MLLRSPQFLHFLPDKDLEMHLMNSYRQLMAATAPVVFLVSEGYGCISAQTKPDEISGAMLYNNAYGHGQFVQECESTYGNDTLASVYAEWLDWTELHNATDWNELLNDTKAEVEDRGDVQLLQKLRVQNCPLYMCEGIGGPNLVVSMHIR
jgi:hypothetical protein